MTALDPDQLSTVKFAVGQPVSRTEDPRLLRGEGRYTDDVALPGQAHGVVLRSPYAHGIVGRLDIAAARAAPGVLAVYTGADLAAAGVKPIPCIVPVKSHDGSPLIVPPRHALAGERVRFVGEPVAFVVAETRVAALDAAERIVLEVETLPAVTDVVAAAAPGAPQIHQAAPGNVCLDWRFGDAEAIERAFAAAAHVTRLRLVNNRVVAAPMEPRAAVAAYDTEAGRFTLHLGCQGVFGLSRTLAGLMGVEPEQMRLLAGNVGGSFGMKAPAYPEYLALLHAARDLGRPVKWRDERSDSFLSDNHGRDAVVEGELALDADGDILALRLSGLGNLGAYPAGFGSVIPTLNVLKNAASVYRTPLISISVRCIVTNTTPVSAYRGAGRPEGVYYMERLIDAAARETGRDPAALRRRNLIPPAAMPYRAASGLEYDSGDFPALLDQALAAADWAGFAERQAAARGRMRLRGIGLACYLEVTAPAGKEMGGLRFEPSGDVTIVTGTLDYGQGHAAAFAQVLADRLGIPFGRIRLLQGDSDALLAGGGTGGSRSIMASGAAILAAAERVIEQGRAAAGHLLEAAEADIEFADGQFRVAGTDRAIGLLELATRLAAGGTLPDGVPDSLDAALVIDTPPSSFPNGVHVAEIEIDPETGAAMIARYTVVDDFGTLVNPMLVEGQVHGGIVQGIGQALMEQAVYDADGNLAAGSFMDYAMPRAADIPDIGFTSHPVPATTNPLGVKGCGEAGVTGALPAVINAIIDALAPLGVTDIDMPATPERLWRAIRESEG